MPAAIIGYIRVSTDKRGKSGLGLEAQREAIARFAAAESLEVAGELRSRPEKADAPDKRPQLAAALRRAVAACRGLIPREICGGQTTPSFL
jgi:DNA invertase Pin-like site-specific DNA recombinase